MKWTITANRPTARPAAEDRGAAPGRRRRRAAFYAFPGEHWPKLRSTNPLERFNREIGRRTDVVGIFPDDASVRLETETSLPLEKEVTELAAA